MKWRKQSLSWDCFACQQVLSCCGAFLTTTSAVRNDSPAYWRCQHCMQSLVQPWVRKKKRVAAPPNTEPTSCSCWRGRAGLWEYWDACKPRAALGLGRTCHGKEELGRSYGSFNTRNLPKGSFFFPSVLGLRIYLFILKLILSKSVQSLVEPHARVKTWPFLFWMRPPGSFHR